MTVAQSTLNLFFKSLRRVHGNNRCFRCCSTAPIWCSLKLGIFICSECATYHRENGDNVKSTIFDRWTEDEVRRMKCGGNTKARKYILDTEYMAKDNKYIEILDKITEKDTSDPLAVEEEEKEVIIEKIEKKSIKKLAQHKNHMESEDEIIEHKEIKKIHTHTIPYVDEIQALRKGEGEILVEEDTDNLGLVKNTKEIKDERYSYKNLNVKHSSRIKHSNFKEKIKEIKNTSKNLIDDLVNKIRKR